jgi:hypothetical protein
VGGVAVDGVVEAGRLVGLAEPGMVPGDGAGELAGPLQERHPVLAGTGVAVDEDDRFVGGRAGRVRLQQRGADAVDGQDGPGDRGVHGEVLLTD